MARAPWGMDRNYDPKKIAERFWKIRPKRVRAPKAKSEAAERDPEYHETRGTLWEGGGTTPQG